MLGSSLLASMLCAALCSSGAAESPTAPEEPWLKDRLEQFQDLKFGFMMHWGVYSQWGCIESWPLVEEDKWARPDDLPAWTRARQRPCALPGGLPRSAKTFNPVNFDPRPWAKPPGPPA